MLFYAALIALGCGVLVGLWRAIRRSTWIDRVQAFTVPVAVSVMLVTLLGEACNQPRYIWNAIRIAPTVAWARGYDMYYPADDGPIQATIYLPGAFLAYWPATLASPSPTHIVLTAAALTQFYILLPLLIFLIGIYRCHRSLLPFLIMLFCLFVFLCCGNEPLHYAGFHNHADAPMICLSALAILAVAGIKREEGKRPWKALLISGCFLALAMFTKQTAVAVALGLGIVVWIRFGFRTALAYGLFTGVLFAGMMGLALAFLDPHHALLFNAFTIPGNHPWLTSPTQFGWSLTDRLIAALRSVVFGVEFLQWLLVLPGIIGVILLVLRPKHLTRSPIEEGHWTWLTWVVCAICFFPVSVVAYAKYGGNCNNFAGAAYFLLFATVALLIQGIRSGPPERIVVFRMMILTMTLIMTLTMGLQTAHYRLPLINPYDNEQEKALLIAQGQPGKIYFPMHPLAMLLAEGRLYHLDEAVYERVLANKPSQQCGPTDAHYRAWLPAHMQYLAMSIPEEYQTKTLQEFTGSTKRTKVGPFTLVEKTTSASP